MSIKVHLRPGMPEFTPGQDIVEVKGSTVGECLGALLQRFPEMRSGLLDENGRLRDYVDIFVNGESSYPEELARPVKDGDELYILRVIGGG